MTNLEKYFTDEKVLSKFLQDILYCCIKCPMHKECDEYDTCDEALISWLKREAEDEV